MKLKSLFAATLSCFILAGCASGPSNYQLYSETQKAIAQANAVADTARYNALLEIAKNGDSAAKVAAVLSIQMGGGGTQRPPQQVAPPESLADTALKWTSVLLPSFAQVYTVQRNTAVAMRQSDNQAAIAISTNNTFKDMNAAGHTANTNIANSGFTANTAGFNALNSSSTAGFNALSSSNTASLNALQATGIAGFNALTSMNKDSTTALSNLGTAGITGVSNTAKEGITGITNTAQNANSTITTLGSQAAQNLNALTTANKEVLNNAVSKLTGTTTTTTTTSNTNNTTSYLSCPPGQSLVTGLCK